jgi:hypothetical protein
MLWPAVETRDEISGKIGLMKIKRIATDGAPPQL